MQLMPADMAGLRGVLLRRLVAVSFEQQEARAARIAGDGERADIGNVGRRAMDRAAGGLDLVGVSLDVVDRDIAHPRRTHAHLGGVFGNRHQPADHRLPGLQERIALGVHRVGGERPADDLGVERLGPGEIVGHLIVPNEFAEHGSTRMDWSSLFSFSWPRRPVAISRRRAFSSASLRASRAEWRRGRRSATFAG